MKGFITLVISALVTCFPVLAQGADGISQTRTQWMNSWNAKQLAEVMALYAEGAVLLPPSGERIVGKDKIAAHFKQIMDSAQSVTVKLSSERSDSSGDIGYDEGGYEDTVTRGGTVLGGNVAVGGNTSIGGGGGQSKKIGSYLVVLKRQAGKWLIVQQAETEVATSSGH